MPVPFVENVYIELPEIFFEPEILPPETEVRLRADILAHLHEGTISQTAVRFASRFDKVDRLCADTTRELRLLMVETDLVSILLEGTEPLIGLPSPDYEARVLVPRPWLLRMQQEEYHLLLVAVNMLSRDTDIIRILYNGPMRLRYSPSNGSDAEVHLTTHPVMSLDRGEVWHVFALVLPDALTHDGYLGLVLERLEQIANDPGYAPVFAEDDGPIEINSEEDLPPAHPLTDLADVLLSAADPPFDTTQPDTSSEAFLYGWDLSGAKLAL
jgi:hypothetical protein